MRGERRPSGPATRVADPLERLLRRIDPDGRLQPYRLWAFWDEVVGDSIARRAQPARISDGVLFVTVSSHTWMQELQFLKEEIRARINERLGSALVRDLRFVSGRVAPRPERVPESAPSPVAVPDLPSTGHPDLDTAMARVAQAYARRRAEGRGRRKKRG